MKPRARLSWAAASWAAAPWAAARWGAAWLLLGGGLAAANAQTVPSFPQASPLEHIMPPAPAPVGGNVPNFAPLGAASPVPDLVIPVGGVTIIGATAFAPATLQAAVAGLAGQHVALATIAAARLALLGLYRRQGFILSTVSTEIDASGNIRFIVTEGRIVAVKLSQDIGPAGSMVLKFLNHLTRQRPVSEAALERWLLLAQQIPGVSVHAVLQADASDPGALTLVAQVAKQDVSAVLTADNRGFREAGPAEGLAVADLNSLTAQGDQSEVSIFHTGGGTDNFGQAAESFYLGSSGLRLKLYGGSGRAHPGGVLRQVQYESIITVFGGQLGYPAILRRDAALTVTLRFDGVEDGIYTADTRTSFDSLRIGRAAAQYAWQDFWAGGARNALNIINVQASQGIPYFGASSVKRTNPPSGRADETIAFWKLNGSIGRTQTLVSPFADTSLALRLEAGGQYSNNILPSEEEFYLGGSRFTRGFYSGQVVGDKSAYATAELQLNTGYDLTLLRRDIDLGAQFYGFYDWGETWSNLPTDLNHRVASAGGGVRLGLTRYLELDGEAVHRITTRLDPVQTGIAPLSETVIYWGVTARY